MKEGKEIPSWLGIINAFSALLKCMKIIFLSKSFWRVKGLCFRKPSMKTNEYKENKVIENFKQVKDYSD
jgi:hypothetical protein